MSSYPQNRKSRPKEYNLINLRVERLMVTRKLGKDCRFNQLWECICDCGTTTTATTSSLMRQMKKSCGCLNKNTTRRRGPRPASQLGIGIAARNKLIGLYRRQASARNKDWDLTIEQCVVLFQGNCYYCGRPPNQKAWNPYHSGDFFYNGIDRLDNSIGYLTGNVVSCCGPCNMRKNDSSQSEFILWIYQVYNHLKSKEIFKGEIL